MNRMRRFGLNNLTPEVRRARIPLYQSGIRTTSALDYYDQLVTLFFGERTAVTDHFREDSTTEYWDWAGAPFVTPTVAQDQSVLMVSFDAANRAFLYRGQPTDNPKRASVALASATLGVAVGLRLDDGTDNNYVELVLRVSQAAPTQWTVRTRWRTGGGAVNTDDGNAMTTPGAYVLHLLLAGTSYTNWDTYSLLYTPFSLFGYHYEYTAARPTGLTWTPTRVGLVFDNTVGAASTESMLVDWVDLDVV